MSLRDSYIHTMHACNVSYVTQAIVNDFAPLLFLWFKGAYDLELKQLSYLLIGNFWLQMCVAFACAKLADRISYRVTLVVGQFCSAAGLALMTVLPELFPAPLAGLTCAVALYAVGGGVVEAVTSPVVEACPFKRKAAAMSLVHSFYCWGQMIVVLGSTLFFHLFGLDNWRLLALVWAAVPLADGIYFLFVPMRPLID
jgi:MFS family permease